jgi:hypothetical protein
MKKAPQKLQIVKAKVSDAQKIRSLETLVWNEEVTNKYDIPMFVQFGYVYTAKIGEKLVGAIIGYKTNGNGNVLIVDLEPLCEVERC